MEKRENVHRLLSHGISIVIPILFKASCYAHFLPDVTVLSLFFCKRTSPFFFLRSSGIIIQEEQQQVTCESLDEVKEGQWFSIALKMRGRESRNSTTLTAPTETYQWLKRVSGQGESYLLLASHSLSVKSPPGDFDMKGQRLMQSLSLSSPSFFLIQSLHEGGKRWYSRGRESLDVIVCPQFFSFSWMFCSVKSMSCCLIEDSQHHPHLAQWIFRLHLLDIVFLILCYFTSLFLVFCHWNFLCPAESFFSTAFSCFVFNVHLFSPLSVRSLALFRTKIYQSFPVLSFTFFFAEKKDSRTCVSLCVFFPLAFLLHPCSLLSLFPFFLHPLLSLAFLLSQRDGCLLL